MKGTPPPDEGDSDADDKFSADLKQFDKLVVRDRRIGNFRLNRISGYDSNRISN